MRSGGSAARADRVQRAANTPADCNWPFCGCDPHAGKVFAALDESGFVLALPEPTEAMLDAAFAATVWPNLDRATSSDVMSALRENMRKEYRAMLKAAMQAPGTKEQQQ